jgi:hypothetical protein
MRSVPRLFPDKSEEIREYISIHPSTLAMRHMPRQSVTKLFATATRCALCHEEKWECVSPQGDRTDDDYPGFWIPLDFHLDQLSSRLSHCLSWLPKNQPAKIVGIQNEFRGKV